jgi:hypothetical protein
VEETALEEKLPLLLLLAALLPTVGCQISPGNPSLDGDSVILHATTGPRFLDSLFFGVGLIGTLGAELRRRPNPNGGGRRW